mmetsp:Transcript_124497/g.295433  ORF Transcript_124497/g.295433 Transcript_124497/m.295433 type:complete len:240 (+) Transcript_124497:101-820(+)
MDAPALGTNPGSAAPPVLAATNRWVVPFKVTSQTLSILDLVVLHAQPQWTNRFAGEFSVGGLHHTLNPSSREVVVTKMHLLNGVAVLEHLAQLFRPVIAKLVIEELENLQIGAALANLQKGTNTLRAQVVPREVHLFEASQVLHPPQVLISQSLPRSVQLWPTGPMPLARPRRSRSRPRLGRRSFSPGPVRLGLAAAFGALRAELAEGLEPSHFCGLIQLIPSLSLFFLALVLVLLGHI